MKITEAQVEASCRIASAVYAGRMTTAEGVDDLVSQHQVNQATAHDFIYDYKRLTQGKLFQRAMSAQAMTYFIEEITSTHGMSGLSNAIDSLWSHIHYYEGHTKTTMHKMRLVVTELNSRPSQACLVSQMYRLSLRTKSPNLFRIRPMHAISA